MAVERQAPSGTGSEGTLEERLERGEIVYLERCPFALPESDDRRFLMAQQHSRWGHKNICYNPYKGTVIGFRSRSGNSPERLRYLMADFSRRATGWLAQQLPRYARCWQLDRATLSPEEEATRRLRANARNDLLHVDSFPTRPTNGSRILRLFVNFHPSDPRVWATSEGFGQLLIRYGREVGLPQQGQREGGSTGNGLASTLSMFFWSFSFYAPSTYDQFMRRFHDFLKANDEFQERSPKRYWYFAPGSAWLAFTDGVSHAVLRGRYALEHSYIVAPETLVLPEEAPVALLAKYCAASLVTRAA